MAPRGRKPKPPGQAVTRHAHTYPWIDVPDVPFTSRKLPARRRDGSTWPAFAREVWAAWSSMPHCKLWLAADWQFALYTIELAARAFERGAKVGLLTELRYREKVMGTTWSARQDMRIRYVNPVQAQAASAGVVVLEQYRNL